jgi:hypothetical protein
MDEITQQAPAQDQAPAPVLQPSGRLSKEERSKVMRDAALRRWDKARRTKKAAVKAAPKAAITKAAPAKKIAKKPKAPPTAPAPPKAALAKKQPPPPREFSSALRTAEKRLSGAILERAKAAATYAVLSAEIPSLQRLIIALKNPLGVMPEFPGAPTYGIPVAPTLDQIVGDQPLAYQNPPRPKVPVMPVPQELHPANTTMQSRAGGGAIGVELEETEDEDQFLKESPVAGGQWH